MRKISVLLILCGITILALLACSADEPEPATEPAPAAPAPAATTAPAPAPAPTTAPAPAPATGPKSGGQLRVTSQASIPSLDGVFSGAYVTAALAVHLTHRLFEWNNDLEAKPMLVESFDLSSDGLSWSFEVRDGITFHDGSALDTDDVIPSLERQMSNFHFAPKLLKSEFVADPAFQKVDSHSFNLNLREPFGQVPTTFAAPWGGGPIIPSEMAATVAQEATPEFLGSGPYKFKQWDQGDKIILERFEDYKAIGTPGSYLADIHNQYLDEIVWLEIPDEETKMAGLESGQWDIVDGASLDFYQRAKNNSDIYVPIYKPGHRSGININHNVHPFDKKEARQALYAGLDIEAIMSAMGDPELWNMCAALYHCNTPLETFVGEDVYYEVDIERAKSLLKEAGYNGEPIQLFNPTDYATITPIGLALKPMLEEIGFVVDMPAQDWATMIANSKKREYALFTTWNAHWSESGDPIRMAFLWPGDPEDPAYRIDRPNDENYKRMIIEYAKATTHEEAMAKVEEIQEYWYENVPLIYLGEWFSIFPARNYVKNFDVKAFPIYTNVWLDK